MIRDQSILPNDMLLFRELASSPGSLSRIQLQQSPENQRVEMFLRLAQSYWSSYTTRSASDQSYGVNEGLEIVFRNISYGRHFLEQNDSRAFVLLNKACFGTRTMLMAQPFRLLDYTVLEFGNPRWNVHWQIKLMLLRYLHSMAQCVFGQEHPISKMVAYLAEERGTTELILNFSRLCIDTMNNTLADSHYDTAIKIQLGVLLTLWDECIYKTDTIHQQVERFVQEQMLNARGKYCRTDFEARCALLDLGLARIRVGDVEEANRIFLETVEDTSQSTGFPNGDHVSIIACSELGYMYQNLGNATETVKYLSLAIEGGAELFGEDHPDVLEEVRSLEVALEEFGMEEKLKQFREQWKEVWARLEDELKNSLPAVSPSPDR